MLLAETSSARASTRSAGTSALRALRRLQVPPAASLSEATIIRIAQLVGAARGDRRPLLRREGAAHRQGEEHPTRHGTGSARGRGAGRARRSVRHLPKASPGSCCAPARQRQPPGGTADRGTLPVFENYVKGLLAETTSSQVRPRFQPRPGYDAARVALWQVHPARATARGRCPRLPACPPRRVCHAAPVPRRAVADPPAAVRRGLRAPGRCSPRRRAPRCSTTWASCSRATARRRRPAGRLPTSVGRPKSTSERLGLRVQSRLRLLVRARPAGRGLLAERGGASKPRRRRGALRARGGAAGDRRASKRSASGSWRAGCHRPTRSGSAVRARRASPCRGGWRGYARTSIRPALARGPALAPAERKDQRNWRPSTLDRARRLSAQQQDREAAVELRRSLYLAPTRRRRTCCSGGFHLRAGRLREALEACTISIWGRRRRRRTRCAARPTWRGRTTRPPGPTPSGPCPSILRSPEALALDEEAAAAAASIFGIIRPAGDSIPSVRGGRAPVGPGPAGAAVVSPDRGSVGLRCGPQVTPRSRSSTRPSSTP